MIPVQHLFESHLNVTDLQRSMSFFGQTLQTLEFHRAVERSIGGETRTPKSEGSKLMAVRDLEIRTQPRG